MLREGQLVINHDTQVPYNLRRNLGDKELILTEMLGCMVCLAEKTSTSVFREVELEVMLSHPCGYVSKTV